MKTPKKTAKEKSVKPSEKAGENYTDAEFEALKSFKIPFLEEAKDVFYFGAAGGTPAGDFIKLCEEIELLFTPETMDEVYEKMRDLGWMVFNHYLAYLPNFEIGADREPKYVSGPPDFFRSISIVLHRRDKCSVKDIRVKNNGRPKTATTLATRFPMMLAALIEKRQKPSSKARAELNQVKKITRAEIISALTRDGVSISKYELSRQLRKHNFNRFMLEQPIARNPRK